MKRSKMIEVMVAAVSTLGDNEIADDLMEVASILEYEWTDEIKGEED